jgi:hypothetical protein
MGAHRNFQLKPLRNQAQAELNTHLPRRQVMNRSLHRYRSFGPPRMGRTPRSHTLLNQHQPCAVLISSSVRSWHLSRQVFVTLIRKMLKQVIAVYRTQFLLDYQILGCYGQYRSNANYWWKIGVNIAFTLVGIAFFVSAHLPLESLHLVYICNMLYRYNYVWFIQLLYIL